MGKSILTRDLLRAIAVLTVLGWPGVLQAETYTWKSVVVPGGGYVSGINYSPVSQGLLYARTDIGGFYRWDSSSSRWIPLNDMFGPSQTNYFGGESIAPDPVNPNVVYAAAGMYTGNGNGVILSSSDQGGTWALNPIGVLMGGNNDGREAGERLAVDPNLTSKLYFASRDNGLWVSTNFAASWSYVTAFPVLGDSDFGLAYVVFDPNGTLGSASATLYVGVMAMSSNNSNLYRSTDAGANWAMVPGGPTSMITTHANLGTDGTLWVVYNRGGYGPNGITAGQVWKLDTSSLAWTNVTPSGGPPAGQGGYGGISVDAQNPQHVIVSTLDWWSGADHVFSTTNGGGTWSVIANKYVGWNVGPFSNFDNNGAVYTRGCGGNDGYVGWAGDIKMDPFNSNNAIYTTGGGVWSSTNINASSQPAGVTWAFTNYGLEETVPLALNAASAGGVFFSALGDVGGLRHTNLDQSPASGGYCNPSFSNTNDIDFAGLNTNIVVRVGNSGAVTTDIAYSTDNGQTWSPWGSAPPGYTTDNQMGFVAVAADGTRVVVSPYRGHGSPAYASALGGSWTACSGLPSGAVLASDRASASTLYAIYPNYPGNGTVTVYASTDYGASFSQVNTIPLAGWGQAAPRAVFGQAGEFWVSSGVGLFRFTNGGSTKAQISNVTSANSVGFGKAATGQSHPALYLVGTVNGTFGFFRCDDGLGAAWTRINDANHQYGNPGLAGGDENVYGRMYVGAGGRGILYGDIVMASPTITPTSACGADTCTPTISPTLTVTRTPTPAPCLMLLNGCNSIFENGTWSGSNAERGIVSSCPATAAFPSEGSGCLAVTVHTGAAYNAGIMNLTGVTPSNFAGFAQLTVDIYFPPGMVTGQGWAQLALVGDSSSGNAMFQYLSTDMPTVTAGFNTCRFNLNYPGSLTSVMEISAIKFVYNAQNAVTGTLYVDNIRLVNPCGLWTATPTSTASKTSSPTATGTPTDTPTITATETPTDSMTPTATVTDTVTLTATPSATPTITGTRPTETPTPSPTLSPSATRTSSPTATGTPTDTPSITPTPTATMTPSATASFTASSTPSPSPSSSATPTATPTSSDTPGIAANEIGLPYPNPVRDSGPVTVGIQVPEPSTVTMAVYTTAFRKVWNGTREVSGQADVTWDLKDNGGKSVANGFYYLKVTVTNNSSTTTKVLKIIVRR